MVAVGVAGWVLTGSPAGQADNAATGPVPHVRAPSGRTAPREAGSAQVARPVRLVIPAIGVSTRLIRLGITSSGAVAVPDTVDVAGWFTGSPRPGAIGSAVILGHIDSRLGPGVFFRLRLLHRGQRVYVVRANRSVATFKVTMIRLVAKATFPSAAVYGPVPDAELRLITCGGQFDYATGSYLSNVIVYATLVATPPAPPRT